MNFNASFGTSESLVRATAIALVLAAGVLAATGALSTPVQAGSSGLAYDEVVKLVSSAQPTPEPGTFAADFQAAVDAQKAAESTPKHGGLFGGITNALNAAKGAMSMIRSGTASRNYFLTGWERTDDVAAQTATITKPQQHQVIYLDLAKKTYRVVDTSIQPVTETPPPYERPPSGPQGSRPPSPQPGTVKVRVNVSTSSLGSKVIANEPTTGYKMDFKITGTEATGSCINGSFETSMVEYVSKYPEPRVAQAGGPAMGHRATTPHPETMPFRPGCKPKVSANAHIGPTAPEDRLAMWVLVSLGLSAQTSEGTMGGGFSTMVERGNVRALGSADKSLFEIPPGFTKEQPSPEPR